MPSMLTLHLVLLNVLNVVQTLRDHEVMPLIFNDFNDETVPGSEMVSHLELRETGTPEVPDVNDVNDVDVKHVEQSFPDLEVTEERLAKAQELKGDDLCSNGTWHLSGDFKVIKELQIGKPCNMTADRVTLFLEGGLHFHNDIRFHGELALVAVRRPLGMACVELHQDGVVEPDAVLRLVGCQNRLDTGGAIHVSGSLEVCGDVHIRDSMARKGGAIFVWYSFTQSGGTLTIMNSSARHGGGAIYVQDRSFNQSGGTLTITDASSESDGGAMWIRENLTMNDKLSITNATAKIGGGIWVGGHVSFENAVASFDQCHALEDGGGIRSFGDVDAVNTSLTFNCSTATSGHGAALVAQNLTQYGGDMVVLNGSAGQDIISVGKWTTDTASAVRLEDCRSSTFLISVQEAALTGTLSSNNCSGAAGSLVSQGPVKLRNVVFNKTSSPQVRAPVVEGSNWNVTGTETWISGTVSYLHKIDCDHIFGGVVNKDGGGCRTCDPGFTFVKHEGVTIGSVTGNESDLQQCWKCPEGASTCNATAIKMSPGLMVDQSNISRPYHCPNPLACPGGLLSANESTPMCAIGYTGSGCNTCATDFARTDSNVFICMKCANNILWKIKEALLFVFSDAVIFAISAAGVITAQRRNKTSAVFLNQLMAFAAVTAPALLALTQTKTFQDKQSQMQQVIFTASIPVQVGDAGESTTAVSTECVLTYLGLQPSLVLAHLLSLAVYLMLALVLTFKSGWRVAVVVAVNCFMPKFCAAFGRYLTCYRMEPASEQDQMQCILEEQFLPGMAISIAAIALCFLAGPGSWVRMIRDKNLSEEPQVLYLTRSYQSGYEIWEVERLIRKMLLKLISTTLPITLNPFSQMAFFSLVLTASAGLHASYRPYAKGEWNQTELSLLGTALVVVILTSLCLAKDIHWARSDELQISLIVLVTGLVTVAGGLQSFLLVRELIRERRPQEQMENEDTSKS